ncbi:MAG: hypothetical protein A2283_16615 [Lentisphaerae bacterium RIFOXYA12_FULL_48_11]|nr:MAG: hypothetical protein A2283_16615 [Lentisphaerae bacterium RIFOXYA12_FULL_48_11]
MKVGIIGFGFMGRMHYRCWKAMEGVEVAAICDADPHAVTDPNKNKGNIAGAVGDVDLQNISVYSDPSKMFADKKLDAVSITVPTFLHAPWTIKALEAGLHVLCEKPMALNLSEGKAMIDAAKRSGKVLQIGHCIRFWPEYVKAKDIIESGTYGRVIAATFQRLAATARSKEGSWFSNEAKSGGMVLDLHIHDTDFVQYLFGMPGSVCSHGVTIPGAGLSHVVTHYCYSDDKLVTAEGGWEMMPSFGFEMRFLIALEKATISFDHRRQPTLKVCPVGGEVFTPPLGNGDGYSRQIEYFVRIIRGESVPSVITSQQALDSLRIVEAERESVQKGKRVNIA